MSDDTVTWTEVCQKVQFGDALYRTCREKVEGFDGFQGDDEEWEYDPETFGDELAESALPAPPPPPEGWEPSFLDGIMEGGWLQWAAMVGVGVGLWWLLRPTPAQQVATTGAAPSASASPGVTASRAA
jgi:hypothetical protein